MDVLIPHYSSKPHKLVHHLLYMIQHWLTCKKNLRFETQHPYEIYGAESVINNESTVNHSTIKCLYLAVELSMPRGASVWMEGFQVTLQSNKLLELMSSFFILRECFSSPNSFSITIQI